MQKSKIYAMIVLCLYLSLLGTIAKLNRDTQAIIHDTMTQQDCRDRGKRTCKL